MVSWGKWRKGSQVLRFQRRRTSNVFPEVSFPLWIFFSFIRYYWVVLLLIFGWFMDFFFIVNGSSVAHVCVQKLIQLIFISFVTLQILLIHLSSSPLTKTWSVAFDGSSYFLHLCSIFAIFFLLLVFVPSWVWDRTLGCETIGWWGWQERAWGSMNLWTLSQIRYKTVATGSEARSGNRETRGRSSRE